MLPDRRQFMQSLGAAAAAGVALSAQSGAGATEPVSADASADAPAGAPASTEASADALGSDWAAVRGQFGLDDSFVHMSAMLLASHPRPVAEAIARHRAGLDANPVLYLSQRDARLQTEAREAAAAHLRTDLSAIALVGSTTHGVGLVYNGLRLGPGDEILTTEQDYYVTHEATRLAAARSGATVRRIELYNDLSEVSIEALADRLAEAVAPETRVLALTWVHSSTGLKLPVAAVAERIADLNAGRDEDRRVLLAVDGVHGYGVEDATLDGLGCDFFMAGCHKWLFGPRGTGIVAISEAGRAASRPTIPSFIDEGVFDAWLRGVEPTGTPDGAELSPGGFKPFEHVWALPDAYRFNAAIGQARIAERTHALAGRLKQGLAALDHVTLVTPMDATLSSGIVSFNVEGYSPINVVRALRERGIIASAAPYATQYARLTPSVINTPEEIDRALEEIAVLA